ncbi:DUF2478 domain-containing protein [Polymorphum gilvum]|uniref:Molybdenum ABC transporter ATP-binding protein n=1 Tax=Polymorphum gilvum (strain LMG 25793 / CGMCC 1.9160 / SL003B-26A1) TaxID=991905 RepID=F2IYU1_POLGS|nr:DUF2478 domain-containing protein [Polymorphum gilvum]ADZ70556.1 Molybdenum ABC transporter ATP-binding protein [Polymorphum gilvum SL003B-26A1]
MDMTAEANTAGSDGTAEDGAEHAVGHLAGIVFDRKFPIDALLRQVAGQLRSDGLDLAGVIQTTGTDADCLDRSVCLEGLRERWQVPVLQDRGRFASGCRLDPGAIADVAGRLEADCARGADLLVVNRFGRAESEGHGLRTVLERALCAGIPVLIGVRADYAEAFEAFHGGIGRTLPPDADAVLAWCRAACRNHRSANE